MLMDKLIRIFYSLKTTIYFIQRKSAEEHDKEPVTRERNPLLLMVTGVCLGHLQLQKINLPRRKLALTTRWRKTTAEARSCFQGLIRNSSILSDRGVILKSIVLSEIPPVTFLTAVCIVLYRDVNKHTKLAIMPILASKALLREKKIQ